MQKHMAGFVSLFLMICLADPLANTQEDGFISLYNGENLEGWAIQGFEKSEPVIRPDGILELSGWDYWAVLTRKKYADFILRFDCLFEQKGNSGVIVHTPGLKDAFKKESFEIQLNADQGEMKTHCTGTLFTAKGAFHAPEKNPTKPIGEWNQVEIQYVDKKLTLRINHVTVYENLDMRQFDHLTLWDDGHIGFQRDTNRKSVSLKNIRICEIPSVKN